MRAGRARRRRTPRRPRWRPARRRRRPHRSAADADGRRRVRDRELRGSWPAPSARPSRTRARHPRLPATSVHHLVPPLNHADPGPQWQHPDALDADARVPRAGAAERGSTWPWRILAVSLPLVAAVINAACAARGDRAATMAFIALRTMDVPSDLPLSGVYSRFGFHHPGPALFLLYSVPSRLLGPSGCSWRPRSINPVALIAAVGLLQRRGRSDPAGDRHPRARHARAGGGRTARRPVEPVGADVPVRARDPAGLVGVGARLVGPPRAGGRCQLPRAGPPRVPRPGGLAVVRRRSSPWRASWVASPRSAAMSTDGRGRGRRCWPSAYGRCRCGTSSRATPATCG